MGWLIVVAAAALFIAMEARRQKRRRVVRAIAVPVGVTAGKRPSWWPAIIGTQTLGLMAYWVVWRDMAQGRPLWLPGFDSLIAFVAFMMISGKIAPSDTRGFAPVVWVLSVIAWILLISVMEITAEGPAVLADFNLIADGIWERVRS